MEGLVQLFYNNTWRTVCDEQWDKRDADVVCRMMGYEDSTTVLRKSANSNQENNPAGWTSNLKCIGNESTLFQCYHEERRLGQCVHGENAIVSCKRPELGENLKCQFLFYRKI